MTRTKGWKDHVIRPLEDLRCFECAMVGGQCLDDILTDLHLLLVLGQHGDVVLLLLVLLLHDGPLALVQGDVLPWTHSTNHYYCPVLLRRTPVSPNFNRLLSHAHGFHKKHKSLSLLYKAT